MMHISSSASSSGECSKQEISYDLNLDRITTLKPWEGPVIKTGMQLLLLCLVRTSAWYGVQRSTEGAKVSKSGWWGLSRQDAFVLSIPFDRDRQSSAFRRVQYKHRQAIQVI